MEIHSLLRKRLVPKILRIFLIIFISLLLLAGGLFTYAYFQYGRMIRTWVTGAVNRESHGLYSATIGSLYLNVLTGNLTMKDIALIPDTALYRQRSATDTLSPLLLNFRIRQFRVTGFRVWEALRNRMIDISSIRIKSPEITVYRMRPAAHLKKDTSSARLMSIPLPQGVQSIRVGKIEFDNGMLEFYDLSGDSVIHRTIPSCTVMISNVLVDSVHRGENRFFNADDISVVLKGIDLPLKNGMNRVTVGEIGLSTGSNSICVKGFHLIPQLNRHQYTRKLGFQTDRLDIYVGRLDIRRFDIRALAFGGKFIAGAIAIDTLVVDDYRDKRVPRRPGFRPAMPHEGIRKLKNFLKVDTVLLTNGRATYSEQTGAEPGTLFFDRMEASLTGLTNDSLLLGAGRVAELKGTAWLMGKGRLDATVRFRLGDPRNAFTFSARLGEMDLRGINPMLTKLLPAEVKSGKVRSIEIPLVTANDDVANGSLLFRYNDLLVAVTSKEESTWNSIKKGVVNFVANSLVIPGDNPAKSGKMRTGVILFTRDKEKGIINYIWKSALSGLKSTMGFNSKEQKAMKKAKR